MLGNCFEVAAQLALDDPALVLVHGRPVAQGGGSATRGERFWHAWVEEIQEFDDGDDIEEIEYAIDKSNGNDITMEKARYYAIGRMSDEHVRRYTRDEWVPLMLEYRHYGPWDEEHPPGDFAEDDDFADDA